MHIEYNIDNRYQPEPLISKLDAETLIWVFRSSHQASKHPPSNGDPHRRLIKTFSIQTQTWFHPLNPKGLNLEELGKSNLIGLLLLELAFQTLFFFSSTLQELLPYSCYRTGVSTEGWLCKGNSSKQEKKEAVSKRGKEKFMPQPSPWPTYL